MTTARDGQRTDDGPKLACMHIWLGRYMYAMPPVSIIIAGGNRHKTGLGKNGPGKNRPGKNGPGKNGPEKTVRGIIGLVAESVKTVRSSR